MSTDKQVEDRVRRLARRQGLRLVKSRTRNHMASDFGTYGLVDDSSNVVVEGDQSGYGLSLPEVVHRLVALELPDSVKVELSKALALVEQVKEHLASLQTIDPDGYLQMAIEATDLSISLDCYIDRANGVDLPDMIGSILGQPA